MSNTADTVTYQFGEWLVEPHLNRIRRGVDEVHLEPKTLETLRYLLERQGEIVSAEELLDAVWRGRIVETNAVHRHIARIRHATGDNPRSPTYIETVSKRGYRAIAPIQRIALSPGAIEQGVRRRSIAVLPLENMSPDPDDAYFAAGIHQELLNRLVNIQALSVIARTSVRKYDGTMLSIPEIAQELNVGAIVEGSVRYANNRVRISAQLIDAATGAQLWSEIYDRELKDGFAVQSEVATEIAAALSAELSPEEKRRLEAPSTASAEAYAHYVKALSMLDRFGPLDAPIEELDSAIAIDPSFAQALALKSLLYTAKAGPQGMGTAFSLAHYRTYMNLASEVADQALALDPDQAIAYMTKASVAASEHRWDAELTAAAKAYELNPNQPFVRLGYAGRLASRNLPDAPRLLELTLERDPQNAGVFYSVAGAYYSMENYARAVEVARQAVTLSPGVPLFWANLASMAAVAGQMSLATESAARTTALRSAPAPQSTQDAIICGMLINCYVLTNRLEDAERTYAELQKIDPEALPPELLGDICLSFGRHDQCVAYYRQALDANSPWMIANLAFKRDNSLYRQIRNHPGFQELLARVPAAG